MDTGRVLVEVTSPATVVTLGRTVEPIVTRIDVPVVACGRVTVVTVRRTVEDVVVARRTDVVVVERRTRVVRTDGTVVVVDNTTVVLEVVEVEVVATVVAVWPESPPPTAAMVTVVDFGEPASVVCALPTASVIEKLAAAVKVDTVAPPPAVAEEVTFNVHMTDEVCTIESMVKIFVKVKSVPETVDNVEHVTSSEPVIVKLIDADVAVTNEAASVTVGATASTL